MANSRLLYKKISYSRQLNGVSDHAQLIFSWMIPHLDNFGKIEGEAELIKAIVRPHRPLSEVEKIETSILELIEAKLIMRYEVKGEKIIAFPTFDKHQKNGINRRTESMFPDPEDENTKNFLENLRITFIKKPKQNENINESERNSNQSYTAVSRVDFVDPNTFEPKNEHEKASLGAWRELERHNPASFHIFLEAVNKGVRAKRIEKIVEEIKKQKNIRIPSAIFKIMVDKYLFDEEKKPPMEKENYMEDKYKDL